MVQYVTYDAVVAINAEFGGSGAGVNDENGIRSAVGQPSQAWGGDDLYPTLWHKAAVLMRGLAATQYFSDGNKRTSYLSGITFLELNGIRMRRVETIYSEVFVLGLAAGAIKVNKAAEWLWATESTRSRLSRRVRGDAVAWVDAEGPDE